MCARPHRQLRAAIAVFSKNFTVLTNKGPRRLREYSV
jgi:hypothetical protein